MAYLLGFVLFTLAIFVSVCLHEAGHLLTANRYTRHDAVLSVRRSYRASEMVALLRRAGLTPVRIVRGAFGQRYAIAALPTPEEPPTDPAGQPDPLGAGE